MARVFLDHNTPAKIEKELFKKLNSLVVGQYRAKKRLVKILTHANSRGGKLRDKNKPAGIIWLLGPSGVGKSHLAHALAKIIFDDPNALVQIDCTQYTEKHDISALIGTKPGYVGFDNEPLLSQRSLDFYGYRLDLIKNSEKWKTHNKISFNLKEIANELKGLSEELKNPNTTSARKIEITKRKKQLTDFGDRLERDYDILHEKIGYKPGGYPCIILLDEVEKAHRSFQNVLYRIFQDGQLTIHYTNKATNSNAEEVSFKNTFIILTANVGEESIKKLTEGRMPGFTNQLKSNNHKDIYNRVMREIDKQFPVPFIRRVGKQNMIICDVLSREELRQGLDRLLVPQLMEAYDETMPIVLVLTESVKEYLLDEAYDIRSRALGMSALQNVFKKLIAEPLSVLSSKSEEEGGIMDNDLITAELMVKGDSKKILFSRDERFVDNDDVNLELYSPGNEKICTFDVFSV